MQNDDTGRISWVRLSIDTIQPVYEGNSTFRLKGETAPDCAVIFFFPKSARCTLMRYMGECGWHLPIRSLNSMDRSFNWVFGWGLDFNKFGLPLEVISAWPIHNPQKSEVLIIWFACFRKFGSRIGPNTILLWTLLTSVCCRSFSLLLTYETKRLI